MTHHSKPHSVLHASSSFVISCVVDIAAHTGSWEIDEETRASTLLSLHRVELCSDDRASSGENLRVIARPSQLVCGLAIRKVRSVTTTAASKKRASRSYVACRT
jgi:hypothetical protein